MKKFFINFQFFSFLLCGVYSQTTCSYSSNGYSLTVTNYYLPYEFMNITTGDTFDWDPCFNGITCGSVSMMASLTNFFSGCQKLAVWDASVPGTYDVATLTWTMEFNNGGPCANGQISTTIYLTCVNGTSAYDNFNSVAQSNGGCKYSFFLSGPSFCSTVTKSSSSKGANPALVAGIVVPLVLILLCVGAGVAWHYNRNSEEKKNKPNDPLISSQQPYQAVSNQ